MRIISAILVLFALLQAKESFYQLIYGKDNTVCQKYLSYINQTYDVQLRALKGKDFKEFSRPKWEKIEKLDFNRNQTLLKRIIAYQAFEYLSKFSKTSYNQYRYDNIPPAFFWKEYASPQVSFYKIHLDMHFDGTSETLIRMVDDDNNPHSTNVFIDAIYVVNEQKQNVDEKKTLLLRQPFRGIKFKDTQSKDDGIKIDDLRTDTNIFFYRKKIYLDSFWEFYSKNAKIRRPIYIQEVTKSGHKIICKMQERKIK